VTHPDLLTWYPARAGHKGRDTGAAAADAVERHGRAARLRDAVLAAVRVAPMTADECAAVLRESVLSIRPRFSELAARGLLIDAGLRRANESGRNAIVWRAA